jgi:hypothetical protein
VVAIVANVRYTGLKVDGRTNTDDLTLAKNRTEFMNGFNGLPMWFLVEESKEVCLTSKCPANQYLNNLFRHYRLPLPRHRAKLHHWLRGPEL